MNKCEDKFCCDCGHHLYEADVRAIIRGAGRLWCVECARFVGDEEVAEFVEVIDQRAGYDARARAEQESA